MELNVKKLFAKGLNFYLALDYVGARRIFNAVLQLDSRNYDALYFRGECYRRSYRNKNPQQSQADFAKSKSLDPHAAEYYFKLGMEMDDIQRLELLSRAIAFKPDFVEAYHQRGKTFVGLHYSEFWLIDKAYADFKKTLELNPNYREAYLDYVWACIDDRVPVQEAVSIFNEIIEREPDNLAAYEARYELCYHQYPDEKNNEALLADANKIIELRSRTADAVIKPSSLEDWYGYFNRGKLYYESKDYNAAIDDFTKSIELNPIYADAYHFRGKCFEAMGDATRAKEDFFRSKTIHCEREMNPYYKLIRYGEVFRELGDYAQALEKFSEAIELEPSSAAAYRVRGELHYFLSDYERALADFNKLIAINPNDNGAYELRGDCYQAMGDYERARADFDKLVALNPTDRFVYKIRGEFFASTGEEARAQQDFEQYEKFFEKPSSLPETYESRGRAYYNMGNYMQAIEDFTRAIELITDENFFLSELFNKNGNGYLDWFNYYWDWDKQYALSNIYRARADAYGDLGEEERYPEDWNKGCELGYTGRSQLLGADSSEGIPDKYLNLVEPTPNDTDAFNNRGLAFIYVKNYEEAIKCFNEAADISPNYAETYVLRGEAYAELGNYELAPEDFTRAIELDPNYERAYFGRGKLYYELKNYDAAIDDFSKSMELEPVDAEAYRLRGKAYYSSQNYAAAMEDFNKFLKYNPENADVYIDRAWAYIKQNKYYEALSDCNKAIEINGNGHTTRYYEKLGCLADGDPDYYDCRGWAYLSLKNYEAAIQDFDRVLEHYNYGNVRSYIGRGKCHDRLGNPAAAEKDFDRALDFKLGRVDLEHEETKRLAKSPQWFLNYMFNLDVDSTELPEEIKALVKLHCKAGALHYKLGQYALAVEEFTKAIDLDPKCIEAYENRGITYDELGEQEKAQADFDKADDLGYNS